MSTVSSDASTVSARKRAANRRNARRSTGPRTSEGKARSARNATTHGIFCLDAVLPDENADHFHLIRDGMMISLRPQDYVELMLCDEIVLATWRLQRCHRAETLRITMVGEQIAGKAGEHLQELRDEYPMDYEPNANDPGLKMKLSALEKVAQGKGPAIGYFIALMFGAEQQLERVGRYEQRLQQTITRCLRELERLRGKARAGWDKLPPSPFRSGGELFDEIDDDDVPQDNSGDAGDGEVGAVEPDRDEKAQNEPTAAESSVSFGPAGACDESAIKQLDPDVPSRRPDVPPASREDARGRDPDTD